MTSLACGIPSPTWTQKEREVLACSLFFMDTLTLPTIIYFSFIAFKKGYKKNKPLFDDINFFVGLTICAVTLLLFLFHFIRWPGCLTDNIELAGNMAMFATPSFMIQGVLTLLYFFIQLNKVFKGTEYEISKLMIYCYSFIWCLTAITCIFRMYYMNTDSIEHSYNSGVVYMVLMLLLNICTAVLFVTKLVRVAVSTNAAANKDDIITPIITRYTILAVISILTTILDYISFMLLFFGDPMIYLNLGVYIFFQLMGRLDPLSNIFAIVLSRKGAIHHYKRLCGCFDKQCSKCFGYYINSAETKMIEMQSKSDLSSDIPAPVNSSTSNDNDHDAVGDNKYPQP